jgi:hypothetical protein
MEIQVQLMSDNSHSLAERVAQMEGSHAPTTIYNHQVKRAQTKKATDLSRNLLVIICEYLGFIEVIRFATSNSILLNKLDF